MGRGQLGDVDPANGDNAPRWSCADRRLRGRRSLRCAGEPVDPATAPRSLVGLEHAAVLLPGGDVLVASGTWGETHHQEHGTVRPKGRHLDRGWSYARRSRGAHDDRSGFVLWPAGPTTNSDRLASADLYDPATVVWTPAPPMLAGRERAAAPLLDDGRVSPAVAEGADGRIVDHGRAGSCVRRDVRGTKDVRCVCSWPLADVRQTGMSLMPNPTRPCSAALWSACGRTSTSTESASQSDACAKRRLPRRPRRPARPMMRGLRAAGHAPRPGPAAALPNCCHGRDAFGCRRAPSAAMPRMEIERRPPRKHAPCARFLVRSSEGAGESRPVRHARLVGGRADGPLLVRVDTGGAPTGFRTCW